MTTTKPGYEHGKPYKVFDNKLKQDSTAGEINQKWCTDSHIFFLQIMKFATTVQSLICDRSVIASMTDRNITSDLAIRTLQKALDSQPIIKVNLILHSDQGSQFTSKAFVEYNYVRPHSFNDYATPHEARVAA